MFSTSSFKLSLCCAKTLRFCTVRYGALCKIDFVQKMKAYCFLFDSKHFKIPEKFWNICL